MTTNDFAAHVRTTPEMFRRTIVDLFGAKGVAWLERLPSLLTECARRWSLTIQPPYPNLSYNYVTPAVRADGTSVVLKLGVPHSELSGEIDALRWFDGHGMAQLLDADKTWGVLLLERLTPGVPLSSLADDEEATRIAACVMQPLWKPLPAQHTFDSVARWARGLTRLRAHFGGGTGPFLATLVEKAETLFRDLLASAATPVLLHGDLHHDNILSAAQGAWRAIDPKGIAGEPAYEVGALLRNPIPRVVTMPNLRRVMARRVDVLAECLNLDRQRIIAWGVAQAVLSAWWDAEDHGHVSDEWLVCTNALDELLM
jgi:streptomycin 6-kinase